MKTNEEIIEEMLDIVYFSTETQYTDDICGAGCCGGGDEDVIKDISDMKMKLEECFLKAFEEKDAQMREILESVPDGEYDIGLSQKIENWKKEQLNKLNNY